MTTATAGRAARPLPWNRARRLLRSPKGYLLLALLPLAIVAAPSTGFGAALRTVLAALLGAVLMEAIVVRWRAGSWRLSSSAVLSGLIISMVLSAQVAWYVAAAAGVLATDGKQVLRLGRRHIFNPAALGLLLVYLLFGSGQSWWGALANLALPAVLIVATAGAIVAQRANKLPAALAFLATYLLVFTAAAFQGHAAAVADIFRQPFVGMALYFGFFMVSDPPTSPVAFRGQIGFGAAVALASATAYLATHSLAFLLVGLLVGNAGYAALRQTGYGRRRAPAVNPAPVLPANRRTRTLGLAFAGSAVAIVLVLGAGVAAFRHGAHAGDDDPPRGSASVSALNRNAAANGGPGDAPAAPPFSAFDDAFTGTVAQQNTAAGLTLDLQLTGTGARPVQLTIHLSGQRAGAGRTQIQENRATLSDASGAPLCQGQVTALSEDSFAIACQGQGAYRGIALRVQGTITDAGENELAGELQVGPADD